ncbi:Spc19-domain-containing protein [Hygrophoropsis aurantiaca]|uniref:Spc19-domain-containing protein n=1 Tax=Hygrophoropsis aurantiaca TaxID=72124 RepID=A0ACB8AHG1_9AGAM|nr:Spc19-domain-containing protein [Hygrophoropsis aurantiaca]
MSRLSTLSRPRESVFAGGPEHYRGDANAICPPNLRECVLAMEDCCTEAHEAQQLLRNGTFDLPRMNKVLDNQKVFLLIDESTVRKYKADLTDEIEPQINELIERAEKGLKSLSLKENLVQNKVRIEMRLLDLPAELLKVEAAQAMQSRNATAPTVNKREERRLQILQKQRQRLEEDVRQLESEVLNLVSTIESINNLNTC